tara:strand:+ start:165 stop:506 length:342 start_codon:yes stop_codon:yes gene_type:complete
MATNHSCEQEFSIGDLVRLKGDEYLSHGIGLVLDRRDDSADIIKDFVKQLGIDPEKDVEVTDALQAADRYLLNTSVYLVHWQGGSTKSVFRNIWMFYNEIELLSKVSSSKGRE